MHNPKPLPPARILAKAKWFELAELLQERPDAAAAIEEEIRRRSARHEQRLRQMIGLPAGER